MTSLPAGSTSPIVVKVGGSLLDLEDLAARLRGLFSCLAPSPIAVVFGGGPAVDVIRHWDHLHQLGDDSAHWLAIRALRVTEQLGAHLLGAPLAESAGALQSLWATTCVVVLAIEPLLREADREGRGTPPTSWNVTSDTLSAWAAREIGAPTLVLAKSVDAPRSLSDAASQGIVDREFPRESAGLSLRWVNLRCDPLNLLQLDR